MGLPQQKPNPLAPVGAAQDAKDAQVAASARETAKKGPLYYFAMSAMVDALAAWEYIDLTDLEASGGTKKVHSLVALLYDVGGKWTVVGFLLALSFLFVGFGIKALKHGKA